MLGFVVAGVAWRGLRVRLDLSPGELSAEAARLRKRGLAKEALQLLEEEGARDCRETRVLNELVLATVGSRGFDAALSAANTSAARKDVVTYNVLMGALRRLPPRKAVDFGSMLFKDMMREQVIPSALSLSIFFQFCSKIAAGDLAHRTWQSAINAGAVMDVIAYSSLINCFAKSAQSDRAQKAFDEMTAKGLSPNERTYSALMDAFAKTGHPAKALDVFRKLRSSPKGSKLDFVSYCVALQCHALLGDVAGALETKRALIDAGFTPNHVIYNCLLEACSKGCDVGVAKETIAEMTQVGIDLGEQAAASMINACGRCGSPEEGAQFVELFHGSEDARRMLYNTLVETYAKFGGLKMAIKAFATMEEAGLAPNIAAYNKLVEILAKEGDFGRALKVLVAARGSGVEPNVRSFNIIMEAASASNDVGICLECVRQMKAMTVDANSATWTSLFRVLLKANMAEKAFELVLLQTSLQTARNFNRVLAISSSEQAVKILEAMGDRNLTVDADTISALVDMVRLEGSDAIKRIYQSLSDGASSTSMVRAVLGSLINENISKSDPNLIAVETQEDSSTSKDPAVDSKSYNMLLSKLSTKHRVDEALVLLEEMSSAGVEVDEVSYTSIVAALGAQGRLDRAFRVIADMEERSGGQGDQGAYVAVITACGKSGQFERAREVIERVRNMGLRPTLAMYNSLLYSAGMGRRPHIAWELFEELEREGYSPDAVTLSAVSSICLSNRVFDERTLRILELIEQLPSNDFNKKVRSKAKRIRAMMDHQKKFN